VARLEGGRGSGLDARRPPRYYGEGAAAHRHRASRERNRPRLGESYEGRTSGTSIRNDGRHGHARLPAVVSRGRSGLNSFRIDRTNPRARKDSESSGPRSTASGPTATSCRSSSKRARPGSGSRSTSARRLRLRDRRDPRGRLDPASRADRARDPRRLGRQADDPDRRSRDRARALPDLELAEEGRFPTRRRSAPPSASSPSTGGLPRAAVVLILLCIGAAAQVERKEAMHQMTELTNTSFDCR
jgi:hypothetical protein